MRQRCPILISVVPRSGMRWTSWVSNKTFISNKQSRMVVIAFKRLLPLFTPDAIGWGITKMIDLVEAKIELCGQFTFARNFFDHIKYAIPWMRSLDGSTLAAFFKAVLLARSRVTTRRDFYVECEMEVPEELEVSMPLTRAIDSMARAFIAKYKFDHYDLLEDYGFVAAHNSDTEPDEKFEKEDCQAEVEQDMQDTDRDIAMMTDNDGDITMTAGNDGDVTVTTEEGNNVPQFVFGNLAIRVGQDN